MQLFYFRPIGSKKGDGSFVIPADTQENAGLTFQYYLNTHPDLFGHGQEWRNNWNLNIAGKCGDNVFHVPGI